MKKIEQLPPTTWLEPFEERIKTLELYLENQRKHTKIEGRIRIIKNHQKVQYYYVTTDSPQNGKYIPKSKIDFVKKIAQNNFDTKFYSKVKLELKFLKNIKKKYIKLKVENYYNAMSQERKKIITPATLPDLEFAKIWNQIFYKEKKFFNNDSPFQTLSGIKVRSKSEVIIAHALEQAGIPFRYEYPIKLNKTIYPDFYCLNLRTRKEYIWEHIGELDNPEYVQKNIIKYRMYTKYGYFLGKNLIITYETKDFPLNTQEVQQKIEVYLK